MKIGRILPPELRALQDEIEVYGRDYGLDFFQIIFEMLDYEQINQVASYGGFPIRYPHWRFGMDFEQLSKGYEYGLQKIYEMVINNNPCYAYLLESNSWVEQKTVIAHVLGHADFFKNNEYFKHTNRRMIDEMANHAIRVRRYIDRFGVEEVESFIDVCLSLDNLIDYYSPYFEDERKPNRNEEDGLAEGEIPKLRNEKDYMASYINPDSFLQSQKRKMEAEEEKNKRFPSSPVKDVMWFLLNHAPLTHWQRDVMSIIREEAYYFAPQGQTKIMNEGWACTHPETLVFSSLGVVEMQALVGHTDVSVSDGSTSRAVYDRHVIRNHPTIEIKTRRGLTLCGSNNHRILKSDSETWVRMDELSVGDNVAISGGADMWPNAQKAIHWEMKERVSLCDVAEELGVTLPMVQQFRYENRSINGLDDTVVLEALERFDSEKNQSVPPCYQRRKQIDIPAVLDERLASFLGYMLGDGHISRVKRVLGVTSGDDEIKEHVEELVVALFGIDTHTIRDGSRWRINVYSSMLADFLQEGLGLLNGPSASEKTIPQAILCSPESVVCAFLSAYFDADGYAGKQGVILSTASEKMSQQVQLLLMNFGILSRRRQQKDGCWHVHVAGASAKRFDERIGFGLSRKQVALDAYLMERQWFKEEKWEDEIVSIEHGSHDVYDISVEETHRYAAAGFINHNSYWHSRIMTEKAATDAEIIDFANSHAGVVASSREKLNPYKLGIELFRDIQERWDKGQFGKEYDDCDNLYERLHWDKQLGLGMEKIFQVRKIYNDVTFIDEFMTEDFCRRHQMFGYDYNRSTGRYEIATREFKQIKEKLLFQLTNFGQPFIRVIDANFDNRSELLLGHRHEGVDLKVEYTRHVLENLFAVWKRPVNINTLVDGKGRLFSFDGSEHSLREYAYVELKD